MKNGKKRMKTDEKARVCRSSFSPKKKTAGMPAVLGWYDPFLYLRLSIASSNLIFDETKSMRFTNLMAS